MLNRAPFRIVGACFIALAIYVAYEAATDLIAKKPPAHSLAGIILACVSLIFMPLLSRPKLLFVSLASLVPLTALIGQI